MWKAAAAALLGLATVTNVIGQGYAAGTTALERAQLPKYCWPQYVDAKKYGGMPGYSIPPSCGVFMNHLCPGLIELIRAQKVSDPHSTRVTNAGRAITNFNYTLNHMLPSCPLRAEVEGYLLRAKLIAPNAK
jgi:hypothetical protein